MIFFRYLRAGRGTILAACLLTAGLAQAANDYFLQIAGIPGDATQQGHEHWIDIDGFSWGLKLVTNGSGNVGKVEFSDFSWTQLVDSSTPKWFLQVATGRNIPTVTLDVTKPVDGRQESFFQMIFTDTVGTSLTLNGAADVMATASMTSGATVKLRYRPQDARGGFGAWVEGSFDIKANMPTALFTGDETALLGLFQSGGLIDFDASAVTPVPEPASAALLLGGLGLLAFRRQRG